MGYMVPKIAEVLKMRVTSASTGIQLPSRSHVQRQSHHHDRRDHMLSITACPEFHICGNLKSQPPIVIENVPA